MLNDMKCKTHEVTRVKETGSVMREEAAQPLVSVRIDHCRMLLTSFAFEGQRIFDINLKTVQQLFNDLFDVLMTYCTF